MHQQVTSILAFWVVMLTGLLITAFILNN